MQKNTSKKQNPKDVKVSWLIEQGWQTKELAAAIKNNGCLVKILPASTKKDLYHYFTYDEFVIFYGTFSKAFHKVSHAAWFPGGLTGDWGDYSSYAVFGQFLFNKDAVFLPAGLLRKNWAQIYGKLAKGSGPLFIKPERPENHGFSAQAVYSSDIEKTLLKIPSSEMIMVASPKPVPIKEYRFIIDWKWNLVAYSQYKQHGKPCLNAGPADIALIAAVQDILDFGKSHSEEYAIDDILFDLDMVQNLNGEYQMLGINGFSISNLYAANKDKIVKAVNSIMSDRYDEIYRLL